MVLWRGLIALLAPADHRVCGKLELLTRSRLLV